MCLTLISSSLHQEYWKFIFKSKESPIFFRNLFSHYHTPSACFNLFNHNKSIPAHSSWSIAPCSQRWYIIYTSSILLESPRTDRAQNIAEEISLRLLKYLWYWRELLPAWILGRVRDVQDILAKPANCPGSPTNSTTGTRPTTRAGVSWELLHVCFFQFVITKKIFWNVFKKYRDNCQIAPVFRPGRGWVVEIQRAIGTCQEYPSARLPASKWTALVRGRPFLRILRTLKSRLITSSSSRHIQSKPTRFLQQHTPAQMRGEEVHWGGATPG